MVDCSCPSGAQSSPDHEGKLDIIMKFSGGHVLHAQSASSPSLAAQAEKDGSHGLRLEPRAVWLSCKSNTSPEARLNRKVLFERSRLDKKEAHKKELGPRQTESGRRLIRPPQQILMNKGPT
jgi:hypothetical protein